MSVLDIRHVKKVTFYIYIFSAKHFEFTKGHNALKGDFETLKILTEKVFTVDSVPVYYVVLGVENKVFVVEITNHHEGSTIGLEIICCVELPGLPTEVCLVGKKGK